MNSTDEAEEFLQKYIAGVRWQAAKSKEYQKFPHEYTVTAWQPDKSDQFEKTVRLIRKHGYREKFFQTTFIYYNVDGKKYWTMGAPIEETTVLNRTDIRNRYS